MARSMIFLKKGRQSLNYKPRIMAKTILQILKEQEVNIKNPEEFERIVAAMAAYAEECTDAVFEMFSRPMIELAPVEDLWRKEHSPDRYEIPDTTQFFKWIAKKMCGTPHLELNDPIEIDLNIKKR